MNPSWLWVPSMGLSPVFPTAHTPYQVEINADRIEAYIHCEDMPMPCTRDLAEDRVFAMLDPDGSWREA